MSDKKRKFLQISEDEKDQSSEFYYLLRQRRPECWLKAYQISQDMIKKGEKLKEINEENSMHLKDDRLFKTAIDHWFRYNISHSGFYVDWDDKEQKVAYNYTTYHKFEIKENNIEKTVVYGIFDFLAWSGVDVQNYSIHQVYGYNMPVNLLDLNFIYKIRRHSIYPFCCLLERFPDLPFNENVFYKNLRYYSESLWKKLLDVRFYDLDFQKILTTYVKDIPIMIQSKMEYMIVNDVYQYFQLLQYELHNYLIKDIHSIILPYLYNYEFSRSLVKKEL